MYDALYRDHRRYERLGNIEQSVDLGRRLGHVEQVALHVAVPETGEHPRLLRRLDALGHGHDAERLGDLADGGGDAPPRRGCAHRGERLVQLERVDRAAVEQVEGRLPGAEVVEGDPAAVAAQVLEVGPAGRVGQRAALGDLDGQPIRRQAQLAQYASDVGRERRLGELPRRDVDAERGGRLAVPALPAGRL